MDAKVEQSEPTLTRIQTANREIILRAALPVFSAYGFRGATVDRIAEAAGMSKPNLLYYFRRKEDIYAAVLEDTLEHWLAPLESLDRNGEPIEELRRYITDKLRLSAEAPEASRLFAGEILNGAPVIGGMLATRLKALVQDKAAIIGGWVAEGRLAPVDPVHLIFTIWATTQHYSDFDVQVRAILGDQVGQPGFHEQTAHAVLSIILNGMRPR